MITGIICEYNPLHAGHFRQFSTLRAQDPEGGIVCLMSGNYVQRGAPAVFDKALRAQAAVRCGADLVLELPVTAALSSAEGFAAEGVRILGGFCDALSFGTEGGSAQELMEAAGLLLREDFPLVLKEELSCGCSFPAARQKAFARLGGDPALLAQPNSILAIEYCKAIRSQQLSIQPLPILRGGSYHSTVPDADEPSATAVRQQLFSGQDWLCYIPEAARTCFAQAPIHSLSFGERAILARLYTMEEPDFAALPYGSEGLWRRLMKSVRGNGTLEEILCAAKSKRYTRSRLDRMVMCAFLGITEALISSPAPYTRVLAFSSVGRQLLNKARETGCFYNIGQRIDHPWQALECRCDDLYELFSDTPQAPEKNHHRRVYFHE